MLDLFSYPQGSGSPLVLDCDHNGPCGYGQPRGLCPLRDLEGDQTLLPLVHTGKGRGLDVTTDYLWICLNRRDGKIVNLVMMLTFLVAICTALLFGLLTEA